MKTMTMKKKTTALPNVILIRDVAVYYRLRPATSADVGRAGRLAREAGVPASVIRLNSYTSDDTPRYLVQSTSGECYVVSFPRAHADNIGVRTLDETARLIARYHVS